MRHAVIDNKTKKVVNVVIHTGDDWKPPKGCSVTPSESANIGDTWKAPKKKATKAK